MKKGALFEILVSLIEEAIKEKDYIDVKYNQMIADKDGVMRQIDVLIQADFGERLGVHRTIIECKEEKKKVGVSVVGGFIDLLNSFDCHRGIIVSKAGFTKPAIQKAEAKKDRIILQMLVENIIEDVEEWMKLPVFTIKYRINEEALPSKIDIMMDERIEIPPKEKLVQLPVYDSDKKLVDNNYLNFSFSSLKRRKDDILKAISSRSADFLKSGKDNETVILWNKTELPKNYFLNDGGFFWIPFSTFELGLEITFYKEHHKSFKTFSYQDFLSSEKIANSRYYEFDSHYLIIVEQDSNSETQKVFVSTKQNPPVIYEIQNLGTVDEYLTNNS